MGSFFSFIVILLLSKEKAGRALTLFLANETLLPWPAKEESVLDSASKVLGSSRARVNVSVRGQDS